jgi:PPP family 3-phenylpropionic acid transporter
MRYSGLMWNALTGEKINLKILYFMYCASLAAWQPLLTVYFKEVGITGLRIGIIMSIFPVMVFLVAPFWGVTADRWGHRRTLILVMFLSSFAIIGYIFNWGFWFFFFWTILVAFSTNPIGMLIDSLILDYVKEKQKSSYGRFRLWGAIGWMLAAPLVASFVTGKKITLIFPIAMAVMFLGWLAAFLGRGNKAKPSLEKASWANLTEVLRSFRFIIFLVVVFFYGVCSYPLWSFFGVYLKDIGASLQTIGIANGLDSLIELPFYFYANFFVKRFGAGRVLTLSVAMFTVRMFLYSIISTPILAVSVELTHGLSYSLFTVATVEYVNELVPPAWRATGLSVYGAVCFGAGAVVGNIFAGYLYDLMPLRQVFRFCGWILLAATIFALWALRNRQPVAGPSQKIPTSS